VLNRGDWVYVRAYGGEIIQRRVVAIERDHVYVCRDEEFRRAALVGEEPVSIGFRLSDVVSEELAREGE
jgi:hypothetical protein